MKHSYSFSLLLSLFIALPIFPQAAGEINDKAASVLLSLAQDKILPETEFSELKNLLVRGEGGGSSFDSLATHLLEYDNDRADIDADSSLVLFIDWYLHLQRTIYSYNKQNFFNSSKTKILLFTTSISCHCTMEMCRKQLIEILSLKSENDAYSFLIVDSYWNNDLQIKYETYFAPSVLVFDSSNKLLSLIEYDEKMSEKLNDTLKIL